MGRAVTRCNIPTWWQERHRLVPLSNELLNSAKQIAADDRLTERIHVFHDVFHAVAADAAFRGEQSVFPRSLAHRLSTLRMCNAARVASSALYATLTAADGL